jgi:hypothetical protein
MDLMCVMMVQRSLYSSNLKNRDFKALAIASGTILPKPLAKGKNCQIVLPVDSGFLTKKLER